MNFRKLLIFVFFVLCIFLFFIFVNIYIIRESAPYIFDNVKDMPKSQVALILGARVYENGKMSDILSDRVIKAIELYKGGKVSKFLVSGDHGTVEYDEVNTAKNYLLKNGIDGKDIFLDYAGFDTYDSVYRAKNIFGIKSLIIVTQKFHLPRAVYIGNSLGMETYGYVADRQTYIAAKWNDLRESFARCKAFFDVIFYSKSKYLGDSIDINGDGQLSWD